MVKETNSLHHNADLSTLCDEIAAIAPHQNCKISGLAIDSRQIQPGDLFLACKGQHVDGRQYIHEAIAKGAGAVLFEADGMQVSDLPKSQIPMIGITQLNQKMGLIAHRFYQKPSEKMKMIAVTGTNGKTSCCHFVANILQKSGIATGVIGTLGNGLYPDLIEGGVFTTPDSIALHRSLSELFLCGAKAVAMEASSHGLDQGRINGTHIDIGIFTNLTRDHLDYHGTMGNYGEAKKRLFTLPGIRYGVINADDDFGLQLINELQSSLEIVGYSIKKSTLVPKVPMVYARDLRVTTTGLEARVDTPWGSGVLTSSCLGRFNLSNLLTVLSSLCLLGLPFEQILAYISQQKEVRGRMETFGGANQPLVVVDFAHTPDALENVLRTLKEQCKGRLICVFGCGGDRDKGKRPLMGEVAQKYSDFIVLTNDNPRFEEPREIIAEIESGIKGSEYTVELDRKNAIQQAINIARKDDIVVIAGKGHEAYQQIKDKKYIFSDQDCVKEILKQ